MAINDDITITKGGLTVTIFTEIPTENLKNILTVVPPVQAIDNQDQGPKPPKVIDLLRITESYVMKGGITKDGATTAKVIKDRLRTIAKGANTKGGPAVLVYEDESINVFISDLVIKKVTNDNASANYSGSDSKEYDVTITMVKGESVSQWRKKF